MMKCFIASLVAAICATNALALENGNVFVCKDSVRETITAKILDVASKDSYVRFKAPKRGVGKNAFFSKGNVSFSENPKGVSFALLRNGGPFGSLSIANTPTQSRKYLGQLQIGKSAVIQLVCRLSSTKNDSGRNQLVAIAKKMATDEIGQEIWDAMGNGTSIDPKLLKGDALSVYNSAVKTYGDDCGTEAEMLQIKSLGNLNMIHVVDSCEGNGCEQFFTPSGQYLNSCCGSESSDWPWDIK